MTHRRFPSYPDDADYTTNAPSYYDELARKEGLFRELAERIWGYEATLKLSLEEIAQRFIAWDDKIKEFDGDVNELLQKWVSDGTLDHIINESIFSWKANQSDLEVTNQQVLDQKESLFYNSLNQHKTSIRYITLTDDDGRPQVDTLLKPILEKYGIPITIGVITGNVGDPAKSLNLAQLKNLQSLGFEMVSHTKTHQRNADIPIAEVEADFKESSEWMTANGFDGKSTLIYPYGSQNAAVRSVARKYYESAFDIDANVGEPLTPPMDTYKLDRIAFNLEDGTNQVTRAKEKINAAMLNDGWVVLMTHCWYQGFNPLQLEEVIQYALANGFEFVTVKKGLQRFSNLMDIENQYGNYVLDADGNGLAFQEISSVASQGFTINTPLSGYPKGHSSLIMYQGHPGLSGFPESGIIETFNSSDNYNHQRLVTYATRQIYQRYWIGGAWTEFKRSSNSHSLKATNSTLISAFEIGTTISNIINADATGLPNNLGGTMLTRKSGTSPMYNYQTIKSFGKEEIWTRHAKSDGTWGEWITSGQNTKTALTLANGWTGTLEISRTPDGQVWLRGMIIAGTITALTTIATLPVGYRTGNYYNSFSAYNFGLTKPMSDIFYISNTGDIRVAATGITTGQELRFSLLFQTTDA